MNITNKAIADLIPYAANAKKHDEKQIKNVAESIKQFGFVQPVVVDRAGVIVIGHCRVLAAKRLGMKEVPCVCVEDLTPEQVNALRLVDNKSNESEWDFDLLADELPGLDLSAFDFDWGLPEDQTEEVIEDEAPEVDEDAEPIAKLGDIWQLGRHRLMCGDSTSAEDVNKLVDGQMVDLLITDPPYNVEIVGGSHAISAEQRKKQGKLTIKNDKMGSDEFKEFLTSVFKNAHSVMKCGACFYVWYASREVVNFQTSLEDADLPVKQELIWNKNSLVMGRQDYQWKHEPCLYGWKDGASHLWASDRKQTTVIDYQRPTKADIHPTMKPVGLFDYQIKNNTKGGDIVLDLFNGSGTTIMACEQNGRVARCMELDPRYVDACIKRWETFTGEKAVLLNDDR